MDGLFTVFGLGTAFGVFCSWMYDVIRKRNQPVARGDSFEAFHGDDVMPAPEPVIVARSVEPILRSEFNTTAQATEGTGSVVKASEFMAPIAIKDAEAKDVRSDNSEKALPNEDKHTEQPSKTDVTFDVSDVPFSDTLSFDTLTPELPSEEAAWVPHTLSTPRVVLLLNTNVVREVQENDFPALMREFGILFDSEQATIFQNGGAVVVGHDTIQLSQV